MQILSNIISSEVFQCINLIIIIESKQSYFKQVLNFQLSALRVFTLVLYHKNSTRMIVRFDLLHGSYNRSMGNVTCEL